MCGIAGFSGNVDAMFLQAATRRLSHRGPDGNGVYHDGAAGVGLAHTRLAIIDLSNNGAQPMWDRTHSVVVSFNGEIYNYRALKSDLERDGTIFESHSDTEVLLALYLRYGTAMLTKLNGIFAFAIWDARTRELFIARDGFGVKPLYYTELSDAVIFASEMKALLEEPRVAKALNPRAIAYHLTYLWCPAPDTILASVKKLEPGCAMIVRGGRISKLWRYYALPCESHLSEQTEDAAVDQVRSALKSAVEQQLVSDVPVGAFLSGGLDSSAVVAMAREAAPDLPLRCFTIDAEGAGQEGFANDLPYAKAVAKHLGVDLSIVKVGPEIAQRLPEMLYYLDEPQADMAPLNALFISELAHDHGIKVLLSGAGGDDIFSGYRRHYAVLQERYWSWLPISARRALSASTNLLPKGTPTFRRIAKAFQGAALPEKERLASYFYWGPPGQASALMAPDLTRTLTADEPQRPLVAALEQLPAGVHPLNAMLVLEQRYFLPDHNLNYTDRMGMAAGVEVRVPFLDPALAAVAAQLPVRFKQRGTEGKWILKKAMSGILPDTVIYRPKTGFGVPLRRWLAQELRPLVQDLLNDESLKSRGLFSPAAVRQLLEDNAANRVDGAYVILALMQIELWCRMFLDRRTSYFTA